MPIPLAALGIMGGAKLFGGLLKNKGKIKAAKEQKRAEDANLQAQYESGLAKESNFENDRLARTNFIGGQLQGARALPPEVLAAALKRRASTVRKGTAADPSKGMGFSALGDVAGLVGDFADAYVKGQGMPKGGSEATSLRPAIGASASGCPDYLAAQGAC